MHAGLHVKYSFLVWPLPELECVNILHEYAANINFHENYYSGS
jgi:hypothetical protein